jgi:hypothetical protein
MCGNRRPFFTHRASVLSIHHHDNLLSIENILLHLVLFLPHFFTPRYKLNDESEIIAAILLDIEFKMHVFPFKILI